MSQFNMTYVLVKIKLFFIVNTEKNGLQLIAMAIKGTSWMIIKKYLKIPMRILNLTVSKLMWGYKVM